VKNLDDVAQSPRHPAPINCSIHLLYLQELLHLSDTHRYTYCCLLLHHHHHHLSLVAMDEGYVTRAVMSIARHLVSDSKPTPTSTPSTSTSSTVPEPLEVLVPFASTLVSCVDEAPRTTQAEQRECLVAYEQFNLHLASVLSRNEFEQYASCLQRTRVADRKTNTVSYDNSACIEQHKALQQAYIAAINSFYTSS
jgi:hypothetical protein